MKEPAIGRNDPCPCGSGKKFKRCCLGKQDFTEHDTGPESISDALGKVLEGQQFGSLDEVQAFLDGHVQQQNQCPMDEFHGLSPEQMHWILNRPFDSPQLVCFPEVLDTQPNPPVMRLFSLLTEAIGEQGLKPTAKGNLPRKLCREAALAYWGEQQYQRKTRFGDINREDNFHELHITRLVAELAGLIRKHKGKFILSRNCRSLLAKGGLAAVYPALFRAYVEQFNWAYRSGFSELHFIQRSFLFTLYLLSRYGENWQPQAFYEDAFLQAFPSVLDELPPNPIIDPERSLRSDYTWRNMEDFAQFFGLADVETTSDDCINREYRIKARPLLYEFVRFQA